MGGFDFTAAPSIDISFLLILSGLLSSSPVCSTSSIATSPRPRPSCQSQKPLETTITIMPGAVVHPRTGRFELLLVTSSVLLQ